MDDSCLCGEGAETFLHMQLACKLKSRKAVIQGAHDDVMRVLVEEVMRESSPDRRRVWDTRVRDLCSFGVGWIRVIPTLSQTAASFNVRPRGPNHWEDFSPPALADLYLFSVMY